MVTLCKNFINIVSLQEIETTLWIHQSIKAILLFNLDTENIATLKCLLEKLIENGTIWFCIAGENATNIEDAVDIIIEDYAAQYGDTYLNAVTISDTDITQSIWEFKNFPDYTLTEIGRVIYDARKYKKQQIIDYISNQSA